MSDDLPGAPSPTPDPTRLVWADVETSGLEDDARLLEIAVAVTDADLRFCGEPVSVTLAARGPALKGMNTTVRTMHTISGLLQDCARSALTVRDAQEQIMDYVCQWAAPGTSPLCGSTIFFDRRFIARDLPVFNAFLHYRHIDVSTVKELARRWFPPVFGAVPRGVSAHRALPDIRDSVSELRFYRETLFCGMPAEVLANSGDAPGRI